MKKRILTLALALTLMVFAAIPAIAAEPITATGGTGGTELSYEVGSTFSVTIPADIAFNSQSQKDENGNIYETGEVELSAGALLLYGQTLTVAMSSAYFGGEPEGFRMKDGTNANYLTYKVETGTEEKDEVTANNETVLTVLATAANVGASTTLTFTSNAPTIAGTYSDTLTFTVTVAPQPAPQQ